MKKDLFIDNNIAKNFCNPLDKNYIALISWLLFFDSNDYSNIVNYAHLVVSKKLLIEYSRSVQNAKSDTSIPIIINKLLAEGRLIIKTNQEIKEFKRKFYSKTIVRRFRSNSEDREHIPLVLLAERKYGLSYDINFIYDLVNFPGFNVFVEKRPEKLPYSK